MLIINKRTEINVRLSPVLSKETKQGCSMGFGKYCAKLYHKKALVSIRYLIWGIFFHNITFKALFLESRSSRNDDRSHDMPWF